MTTATSHTPIFNVLTEELHKVIDPCVQKINHIFGLCILEKLGIKEDTYQSAEANFKLVQFVVPKFLDTVLPIVQGGENEKKSIHSECHAIMNELETEMGGLRALHAMNKLLAGVGIVAPVVVPTVAPVMVPTVVPTVAPIVAPTVAPVVVPTVAPVVVPATVPAVAPTKLIMEVPAPIKEEMYKTPLLAIPLGMPMEKSLGHSGGDAFNIQVIVQGRGSCSSCK